MIQRERTTSDDKDDREEHQRDARDGSCRKPDCYLPPEHEEPCLITVLK